MITMQKIALSAAAIAFSAAAWAAPQAAALPGGTWLLSELAGQAATGAHLRFAAQQAVGNDACNQFRSSYQAGADGALKFDPAGGAATLMACAPEQEATSKAFKAALAQTQSYRTEGKQLQLLGAEKKVLAVFALQNEKLAGTHWQVQGLNNGKNAVVSQASLESIKLAFLPAGKLQISTPCGQLQSYYRVKASQQRISVRKPRADGKVCAKSDAAHGELQQVKQALKRSASYQITADRLELRDKKGALQISAQLQP